MKTREWAVLLSRAGAVRNASGVWHHVHKNPKYAGAGLQLGELHAPTPPARIFIAFESNHIRLRFACGARAKEVADELGISIHTVRAATREIYVKLDARSTAEAVAIYLDIRGKD